MNADASRNKADPGLAAAGSAAFGAIDFLVGVVLFIVAAAVFANSVPGEFVYDDLVQIVENDLIKSDALIVKALTSDVWAFKGDQVAASSNYWRPTFVAQMIVCYRLFGLEPAGWHIVNLLMHGVVTVLAFVVMRQLRLSTAVAGGAALIFAVHPVHVESVAWIAGSPDMLVGMGLLGALACVLRLRERASIGLWVVAVGLFAFAQGAKEIAVFFPAIVFLAVNAMEPAARPKWERWKKGAIFAVPFGVVSVAYLIGRHMVLGGMQQQYPWKVPIFYTLDTMPQLAAFYLRQTVAPVSIGPSYPLRAVGFDQIGLWNFIVPSIVVLVVGVWSYRRARKDRLFLLGLAMFVLLLAPAMNINAFIPEQLVHDRYLYLPLLGFLIAVIPLAAAWLVRRAGPAGAAKGERWLAAGCCIAAALLAIQTVRYNRAWLSEEALWTYAVRHDPTSGLNHTQYGMVLAAQGRLDEARSHYDKAIELSDVTQAYIRRAEVAIQQRRYDDAERDLEKVIETYPDILGAYERLAVLHQRLGRWNDAKQTLERAREAIPHRRVIITLNIAVLLYESGALAETARELESVREDAGRELGPGSKQALFRLGMVYAEMDRHEDGARAMREFLSLTESMRDPETVESRMAAEQYLQAVGL